MTFILEIVIPTLTRYWNIHIRVQKKKTTTRTYPQPVQIIQGFTAYIYTKHFFILTPCSRVDIAIDIIFEAYETNF